jgi:uncharacterized protein with ParB-like and HNH nuclease domain
MKTGRYSLKQLLTHNEIEQIIIPEIQRDYVWEVSNVKKLIGDIQKSFEKKSNHQIEIKVNGKDTIPESISQFLSQEYERLVYQQKLGFIYAYHDRDYAGKFFLIDGQQRITTLYLMLLYLYRSTAKPEEFKTFYFNNEIPKVDYKVREQSHDFLHLLIKSFLNGKEYKDSEAFYGTEYLKDTTIKHLIENFEFIRSELSTLDNKLDFLYYLENFVEVNYFDTHLSEQGEQLYIYMNSRGEQLSHQEIIRAELMQKVSDTEVKIELGKEWEKWQNFFWKHRGGNENADNGFEEFLKWAVIIHLLTNENVEVENFADSNKTFTPKQLKENLIKDSYIKEQLRNQKEALLKYQVNYLDFKFLQELFDSIEWVYSNKTKYIPIQDNWLSSNPQSKVGVLNYVLLLPVLYYQMKNKWEDDESKIKDVEQLSMFLKNITYFEAVSKNPDTATLDALEIVNNLIGMQKDIIHILNQQNVTKTILTDAEKYKLEIFINEPQNREDWQKKIWEITLDDEFNKFLMGDITVIWKCIEKEKSLNPYYEPKAGFAEYADLIKEVIFKNRTSDNLRRLILSKFDYMLESGTGGGYEKYSFIGNGSSWEVLREWKETLVKDDLVNLMVWVKNKANYDLKKLLLEAKKDFVPTAWREAFIDTPALLNYCSNKKILWQDENRILLLEKTNYSLSLIREIQCALLQNTFINEGMWIFENNCCVLEFDWNKVDNKIDYKDRGNNGFTIDFKYWEKDKEWTFTLFHRNQQITEIIDISNYQDWIIYEDRLSIGNRVFYNYDIQKTLLENNTETNKKVNGLISKIEILLKNI